MHRVGQLIRFRRHHRRYAMLTLLCFIALC